MDADVEADIAASQWTKCEGDDGIPFWYNESTGETLSEEPEDWSAAQTHLQQLSNQAGSGGELEGLSPEGVETGNAENSEPVKEPQTIYTYNDLLHYGENQALGKRGITKLKKNMSKNIFDTLQLHQKVDDAPVLQELEKVSIAHVSNSVVKEVKLATDLIAEAERQRKLRKQEEEEYSDDASYYSYSYSESENSSASEQSDSDKSEAVVEVDPSDENLFKNEAAHLPEYMAIHTDLWEDFMVLFASQQSHLVSAVIFLGMLLAVVNSRLAVGLQIGDSAYNAHWNMRALSQVWLALLTWWIVIKPHKQMLWSKLKKANKYEIRKKPPSKLWQSIIRAKYLIIFVVWCIISVSIVCNAMDRNIIGETPYPRIWVKRANKILVKLFYFVLWYLNLIFIPAAVVWRIQIDISKKELQLEQDADHQISISNLIHKSKRPINPDLLRERAKAMNTRKLSRTMSFFAKQYRYHDDSAIPLAARIFMFSAFLEVLHILAEWPSILTQYLVGVHSWNVILAVPLCLLLLRDEDSILIERHAGYCAILLHLQFVVIPSAASSFMESIVDNPEDQIYQMGGILAYHIYMQMVIFVAETLAVRAWHAEAVGPLINVLHTLDCMFANFLIVFASDNMVVSGLGILMAFLRTAAWELGFWKLLFNRYCAKPQPEDSVMLNVAAMDQHHLSLCKSKSRFLIQMVIGLMMPIILGFESVLGFGQSTLSSATPNVMQAGAMIFGLSLLNLAVFLGAWFMHRYHIKDLWSAIIYDPAAGKGMPTPQTGTLKLKLTLLDHMMKQEWLTMSTKEISKSKPEFKSDLVAPEDTHGKKKRRRKVREGDDKPEENNNEGEMDGNEADDEAEDAKGSILAKVCSCVRRNNRKQEGGEEDAEEDSRVDKQEKKATGGNDDDNDDDDNDDSEHGILGKLLAICRCRKPKVAVHDDDDDEKRRHDNKKHSKRQHNRHQNHEWHSQFYAAGLLYAVYEPTSRAALLGSGQCTECTEQWVWFGIATAGSIVTPVLLLVYKRFIHRVVAAIKQAKKNKKETGSYFDSAG